MPTSPQKPRIIFISTMGGAPWGGSEELWSRAALNLLAKDFRVSASVNEWSPPHGRIISLIERGVDVWQRPRHYSLWDRAWHQITSSHYDPAVREVQRLISAQPPELVVMSSGTALPPIEMIELCIKNGLAFVTIGQANWEGFWIDDTQAKRYRRALPLARRCFFVSNANRKLTETQIGLELANAEIVFNPFNVDFHALLPWPPPGRNGELHVACVGRLHPPSKGQDILLEALAGPAWATRQWRLHLCGDGPMRDTLKRLVHRLGLCDRVVFVGHLGVEQIWATNHALIMPSRYEGMPLAMVEAMLCARAVVATDVAGHAEIIEEGVTGFLADAPTVRSMSKALERFWDRRGELEKIGQAAASRIRRLIPPDPAQDFALKVKELAVPGLSEDPTVDDASIAKISQESGTVTSKS